MSQVLAIKYRPRSFNELIGQDSINQTLSLALKSGRLSHAYLFSGLRGTGKTSTARIFSKALVCQDGPTPTPCGTCPNCLMAQENRHIDIIEMDAAANGKIEDIRDLIEQTKYKPTTARFKIFIIDEVHMLTRGSFNALLKTLEEPPEYIKFILATTDPLKLPPTVLSRTQHFRFKQISKIDILHHLENILNKENIPYEVEALEILSRSGSGSLRDTLTLLDQAIIFSKTNITQSSVALMLGLLDPEKIEEIFDAILKEDRKRMIDFTKELETYDCEVIIDELIAYLKEKFYEQDVRFSMLLCERFFRILSEAKSLLFVNADSGFVLSLVFFKMMEALNLKSIDEMIKGLESEKFRTQKAQIEPPKAQTPTLVQPKAEDKISDKFEQLLAKIYDRDYDLGECFKSSIEFVKFEDDILYLNSNPQENCRAILRTSSGAIKHVVQEVYGIQASIKIVQKPPQKTPETPENKSENESPKEPTKEQIAKISPTLQPQEPKKEPDLPKPPVKMDILDEPLIKKAQELFDPEKIQVFKKH